MPASAFDSLPELLIRSFGESIPLKEISADPYTAMSWPRFLPMMRFRVRRWQAGEQGYVFLMQTRAMGGLMKLITASFMPASGIESPFVLMDCMEMRQKRTVFVEYYDCTANGVCAPELDRIREKYDPLLTDYTEKPAWYIQERMDCSLIKGGTREQEALLLQMLQDSARAYGALWDRAPRNPANLPGLAAFRSRMLTEGNPSSSTMEKVLGKEGAKAFFLNAVMPMYTTQPNKTEK